MNLIETAASSAGLSVAGLAREIGVSKAAAHQWALPGRGVPIEHCVQIERITNGAVMRWDLRPNDWWKIWPELIDRKGSPSIPSEVGHE